jgi:hypothetical protein
LQNVANITGSRLITDSTYFIEQMLWIVDKERKKVPFKLNYLQQTYEANKTLNDLILKPRKEGFSSYIEADFLHDCIFVPNTNAITMAHTWDDTVVHMDRVKYFLEHMGPAEGVKFKVEIDKENQRELYFPKTNSRYWIGTAGSRAFGRGRDVTRLHLSEAAFYPSEDVIEGVLQACVDSARKAIETTANGIGGLFHRIWTEASAPGYMGPWKCHFYAWWENPKNVADKPIAPILQEHKDIQRAYSLTDKQIYWYVNKEAGMLDKSLMPQEYPSSAREAFLTSGKCIFDRQGLVLQERKIVEPLWRGYLRDMRDYIQPMDDEQGNLLIYETPKDGEEYVCGADTSEGVAGGDYSSAHVVNKRSWKVCAVWHGMIDPLAFGDVLYLLGLYFNTAEMAPEINNMGIATVKRLQERGYTFLYQHEKGKVGWRTDMRTRANAISTLQEVIRDGSGELRDRGTLDEFYNFIRHDDGKIEAREGCHDDRVMSAGIAYQICRVNPFYEVSPRYQSLHRKPIQHTVSRRRTGYG